MKLLISTLIIIFLLTKGSSLTVSSTAFEDKKTIPAKYTCEGENINPPLTITGIPPEAKSLALIVDDPDAPNGTFDHWISWNIPVRDNIAENEEPGTAGKNGAGEMKYKGPCPPSGTHRYFFKVYALDIKLSLTAGASKKEVQTAMTGHILSSGELVGTYQKTKNISGKK